MKTSLWRRPGWRLILPGAALIAVVALTRALWSPGLVVTDGRHDLGRNAMWLQHGWIGADSWFVDNDRQWKKPLFRSDQKVRELAALYEKNGIQDVYPHLCPTQLDGSIMAVDDKQLERFLTNAPKLRVMPWIGGPLDSDVDPNDDKRTAKFVVSAVALLKKHPRLAGVHLNVEPWPSGNVPMLHFLETLRGALPKGKILSVAAYPPPSRFQPFTDIHWDAAYFQQVAARCDQMAVMMYDTSLRDPKMYQWLYAQWTKGILDLTKGTKTEILFGLPNYDDAGSGYHNPYAENLDSSLRGLHRGLSAAPLPPNYAGAAIYCEWEMDGDEWKLWQTNFRKK